MIRLRRIDIQNFVCFDRIVVTPSIDREKRLTVIRAENGSGKTTFLRAVRWGMYGEAGLPGADKARFSIHPADWVPDDTGIVTKVEIEFESDGSTRHHPEAQNHTSRYNLSRRVTTIRRSAKRDDEPDFHRKDETPQLMKKGVDGAWSQVHHPGAVIEELLPWGLREFFVMDADEAADFVGGSENKAIARREVIRKTTAAVQSLLGINVFRDARKRMERIRREFGSEAARAIGDESLNALQDALDDKRRKRKRLERTLANERERLGELADRLLRAKDDLETEVKDVVAAKELSRRREESQQRSAQASDAYQVVLRLIVGQLESVNLLGALARPLVEKAYRELKPLHDAGKIPLRHLQFVRGLLVEGLCVCGQDLSAGSFHRREVESRVTKTEDQEMRAEYLQMLYDGAHRLRRSALADEWRERTDQLSHQAVVLSDELAQLKRERVELDAKLDMLDDDKIQTIRDEIGALETQRDKVVRGIAEHEIRLPPVRAEIQSLEKRIGRRTVREEAARHKRAAEEVAGMVVRILAGAYRTIESDQVEDLSKRMNRLFKQMAANVADKDEADIETNKATLRMIAQVGVRPVDDTGQYEICAFNGRGRLMPPTEINGASRRVLALSFVLALCIESRTHAPLIADSLLNFMSGAVRRNTLLATAQNSSQPILLLTNADLEGEYESNIVSQYGGATFTLTGQWDVKGDGGGDVLKASVNRKVAVLCNCGARQYCDVCEREGQSEMHGWTRLSDGVSR